MDWFVEIGQALIATAFFGVCYTVWRRRRRMKAIALLERVVPLDASHLSWWQDIFGTAPTSRLLVGPSLKDDPNDPSSRRVYTHTSEVNGLVKLAKALAPYPVDIELRLQKGLPFDLKHQLLIGGTFFTPEVRELIEGELIERGVVLRQNPGKHESWHFKEIAHYCQHEGRNVKQDPAIICRINKANGQRILLCSGIHSFGTAAAIDVALDPEFQEKVRRSGYTEFVQFVGAPVIDGQAFARGSLEWNSRKFPLVNLGTPRSRWQKVLVRVGLLSREDEPNRIHGGKHPNPKSDDKSGLEAQAVT